MNNIKLIIKRLGPITDTEINMAPVMIFTGSSNLGKSYVNFLTYYVMNLFSSNRIAGFLQARVSDKMKSKGDFSFHFSLRDLCQWMEKDVKVFFQYLLNYPNVPCEVGFEFDSPVREFNVTVKHRGRIKGIFEDIVPIVIIKINDKEVMTMVSGNDTIEGISAPMSQLIGNLILDLKIKHAYLLPPGRASLLNESFSRQAETSKIGMYDIFLRDFDRINNLKNKDMQKLTNGHTGGKMDVLINGVLNSTKDGLFLKLKDKTEIPLSAAASSIKELSPFLLWMQTKEFYRDSMCIEEPEAHAHPEMQYGIADLIAMCINQGALIQMTTHSDYLLARLNQLIKLHDLKNDNPALFEKICRELNMDKELVLDKAKIKAYYFSVDSSRECVKVEEQDVSEGIPFTTFMDAVKMQMKWDSLFEESSEF